MKIKNTNTKVFMIAMIIMVLMIAVLGSVMVKDRVSAALGQREDDGLYWVRAYDYNTYMDVGDFIANKVYTSNTFELVDVRWDDALEGIGVDYRENNYLCTVYFYKGTQ